MDELAGCYQLAGCDQQTENQNITAYGIIFFVIHLLPSTVLVCESILVAKWDGNGVSV